MKIQFTSQLTCKLNDFTSQLTGKLRKNKKLKNSFKIYLNTILSDWSID